MKPAIPLALQMFFKNIWKGIVGILAELALVIIVICAGFVICIFWQRLFG